MSVNENNLIKNSVVKIDNHEKATNPDQLADKMIKFAEGITHQLSRV